MKRLLPWSVFSVIVFLASVKLGAQYGVALGLWWLLSGVGVGYVSDIWQQRHAAWMGAPFAWAMWLFAWPLMLAFCVWHNERRKAVLRQSLAKEDITQLLRHSPNVSQPKARGFRHPQVLSLDYLAAARTAGGKTGT